jgi:hypothetical protein
MNTNREVGAILAGLFAGIMYRRKAAGMADTDQVRGLIGRGVPNEVAILLTRGQAAEVLGRLVEDLGGL